MIEVFLFGIVLGLIPITLAGLFVTAYLQYRRGDQIRGVGMTGFEPVTFCTQNKRATKLRYILSIGFQFDCKESLSCFP
ncbi:hypothetical protein RIF29_46570 [Crotalaria pallida]|uniref:Uncharacterized protein n=1 Tax=Crotalaria pallida TaxID=3830 RepID=A0AAN9DRR6_CROPI